MPEINYPQISIPESGPETTQTPALATIDSMIIAGGLLMAGALDKPYTPPSDNP